MGRITSFLLTLSTLLVSPSLTTLATAATPTNGSTFIYSSADIPDAQFVFALNVNKQTGDIFFHLGGPSGQSWLAVGVGDRMAGATMFITYASSNQTGITLSPRTATGETEPSYDASIQVQELWGDQYTTPNTVGDTSYNVDAVCRGCVQALGSNLDLTSTAQDFIFAMGPPFPFAADSPSAGLWEHQYQGRFTIDMTQATSADTGAVPLAPYTQTGASLVAFSEDFNPAPQIHGAVMCIVFVLIWPFGALFLKIFKTPKAHIILQSIGTVLFLMSFAGGCYLSSMFNRSKNYDSAHQIIGMLMLVAVLAQWGLGFTNHRIFKRTQQGTIMGKIHRYLGPAVIFIGLVNGGLGFKLAETPQLAIPYIVVIVIVAAVYCAMRFCACTCLGRGRRKPMNAEEQDGFQFPTFGNGASFGRQAQSESYAPPVYGNAGPPAYGSDDRIPLQPYHSSTSVQQLPTQGVEPRGMI